MRQGIRSVAARGMCVAIIFGLSACGGGDERPAARASQPERSVARADPRVELMPAATAPESLWHLRAGLNVAALSCRGKGRVSVAGAYRQLLSRHRAILAAAYKDEERRHGARGFDRHQTRLYNRFAYQRSPERFCQAAARVAGEANRLDSTRLGPASRGLLSELERHL